MRALAVMVTALVGCSGGDRATPSASVDSASDVEGEDDAASAAESDSAPVPTGDSTETITAPCELRRTYLQDHDASDQFSETKEYWARFPGKGGATALHARGCDWISNEANQPSACSAGHTCTGQSASPMPECEELTARTDGSLLHFWCGFEIDQRYSPGGAIVGYSGRWTTVTVEIK